jgi:signal transduction histidine kinase
MIRLNRRNGSAHPSIGMHPPMTVDQTLIANGTVDRQGRLVAADPRLLALQLGAGGEEGGILAVPQIAALAKLARTLGILVSRGIVAADGERDLDLWVRAQPAGDQIDLAIAGWNERPLPDPNPDSRLALDRARSFAKLESDGDWACDAQLRLTDISSDLVSLSGVDAASTLGLPLTRFFRLLEDDQGDLPLLAAMAERQFFATQLAELRNVSGVRLWLHGELRIASSGDFAGFAGGYRLIERSFEPRRAVGIPSNVVDEGFAQRLDTALRTPLSRIISNADSISGKGEGPLRHDYVDYASDISAAGRHLLGLVDDLVDLQAVESPGFRIQPENIDLADIARRAAGLLGVRAADRGVRIDLPPSDENLDAQGEFRRVLQIMVNLIANAVRYSPKGSSIWLRTEREGDLAAVIVADQGKGIPVADQDRIFEKFERVDPSEPGGSGLGLFISRRLARAMGGDITVDSAPGQGARFVLTLPLTKPG